MKSKALTRKIAFTAVFTAFSTAFLYIASVFPTGQLGFLGVASLFGIAAVLEYGLWGGAAVFLGTSLIGLLIVPSKSLVALYAVFFGYYPILKSLTEKLKSRVLEWGVKLIVFNAALTAAIFALTMVIFDFSVFNNRIYLIYLVCNAVFILFDIGVSRVIAVYMAKIYPKIHKKN